MSFTRSFAFVLAVTALTSACGGSTSNSSQPPTGGGAGGTGGSASTGGSPSIGGAPTGGAPGGGGSSGNTACSSSGKGYAGIHIDLAPAARCTFSLAEAAAGIEIGYAVGVDQDVSGIVPTAQTTCAQPGSSGLYVFEQLSGGGQSYCVCDSGLCPPPPSTPITLKAGSYPAAFSWDGKNWSGPSDTGNPKGPAFPVGTYTLRLSAKASQGATPFEVFTDIPITLTP